MDSLNHDNQADVIEAFKSYSNYEFHVVKVKVKDEEVAFPNLDNLRRKQCVKNVYDFAPQLFSLPLTKVGIHFSKLFQLRVSCCMAL